jgi:hypothetical protein
MAYESPKGPVPEAGPVMVTPLANLQSQPANVDCPYCKAVRLTEVRQVDAGDDGMIQCLICLVCCPLLLCYQVRERWRQRRISLHLQYWNLSCRATKIPATTVRYANVNSRSSQRGWGLCKWLRSVTRNRWRYPRSMGGRVNLERKPRETIWIESTLWTSRLVQSVSREKRVQWCGTVMGGKTLLLE